MTTGGALAKSKTQDNSCTLRAENPTLSIRLVPNPGVAGARRSSRPTKRSSSDRSRAPDFVPTLATEVPTQENGLDFRGRAHLHLSDPRGRRLPRRYGSHSGRCEVLLGSRDHHGSPRRGSSLSSKSSKRRASSTISPSRSRSRKLPVGSSPPSFTRRPPLSSARTQWKRTVAWSPVSRMSTWTRTWSARSPAVRVVGSWRQPAGSRSSRITGASRSTLTPDGKWSRTTASASSGCARATTTSSNQLRSSPPS